MGAAWTTLVARGLGCVVAAALLVRQVGPGPVRPVWSLADRAVALRIVRLAWPQSAQFLVRVLGVLAFVAVLARFHTSEVHPAVLGAFGICVRLDTVALFAGKGWGLAASALVSHNLGAGLHARAVRAGWMAAAWNVGLMAVVATTYLLFGPEIVGFFDPDPDVVAVGRRYLGVVAGSYLLLGVAVVLSNALSGAGDTLISFLLDFIIIMGLQVPLLLVLAWWGASLDAIFALVALGNAVSALAYGAWYARGRWGLRPI
jgi:Na+-driven multidrug efflux pump